MEISATGSKIPAINLSPGKACFYKGQLYMCLTSVRVKDLATDCVPLANLSKGTIRKLPGHCLVEPVEATVEA